MEEDERFKDALEATRAEVLMSQAEVRQHAAKLNEIRHAETLRARQLALHHRRHYTPMPPTPVDMPQQKHNYLRRTTLKDGRTNFDDTYHHRDFNTVSRQDHNHGSSNNATEAARMLSEKLAAQKLITDRLAETRITDRDIRFTTAMHDVEMNHEALRINAALKEAKVMDGRRRQVLSDWVNAKDRGGWMRNPIASVSGEDTKQKLLTQFFDSHFPGAQ